MKTSLSRYAGADFVRASSRKPRLHRINLIPWVLRVIVSIAGTVHIIFLNTDDERTSGESRDLLISDCRCKDSIAFYWKNAGLIERFVFPVRRFKS